MKLYCLIALVLSCSLISAQTDSADGCDMTFKIRVDYDSSISGAEKLALSITKRLRSKKYAVDLVSDRKSGIGNENQLVYIERVDCGIGRMLRELRGVIPSDFFTDIFPTSRHNAGPTGIAALISIRSK